MCVFPICISNVCVVFLPWLVFSDLCVPNCWFPTCISRFQFPICFRFVFSNLYLPDLLLPMYTFRPVFVFSICIGSICLSRLDFPICIFLIYNFRIVWIIFSEFYFPMCGSELYLPICILSICIIWIAFFSMLIFQLFNTLIIVFSALTHTKTLLTTCCILDGLGKYNIPAKVFYRWPISRETLYVINLHVINLL